MISVAGIRGIVGESLTAPVVSRYAAAFAETMGAGPIVVGRDARPSGPWMYHAVAAGLLGMGREVVNLGLATTPTTQLAVETMHAAGGIIITASHNPSPWNALKLLSPEGEFLGPEAGQRVQERYRSDAPAWRDAAELGHEREESGALERHLERVLGLSGIDLAAIRARS
jgi:phosphomannomutase